MRSLSMAVGLTALLVLSGMSSGNAASSGAKTHSNASASKASTSDVPPNCIRQACGKLWCWQMGGGKGSR